MKQYPRTFSDHSSYGSAVRLLDAAGIADGVVLDLGCGRSPLAEPLAERGLTHVGCDVDTAALADLAERGSETHEVSLLATEDELLARLTEVLAGRPLAAVLALDVLEHLPEPTPTLLAVRRLVLDQGAPAPLVVSIPNVTHVDVGAKLVLGRWDVDDTGLLDDTHLRFFGEHELGRLLQAGGWTVAATDDVELAVSDQAFPSDAPTVRRGAPLHELLASVRTRADAHARTYQFVRLLTPVEPTPAPYHHEIDEERPLVAAVVVVGPGTPEPDALLADLARQDPPVGVTVVERAGLDDALRACGARWVAVLDPATRLGPDWSARLLALSELAVGKVVRLGGVVVADAALAALPPGPVDPTALADSEPLAPGAFDPLHAAAPAAVSASAYLVPVELVRAAGLHPGEAMPMGADLSLWIARAVQLGGIFGTDAAVVVAARSSLCPPGAGEVVTDALDAEPLLLPAGSAGRLADLRSRVLAAEGAMAEAADRVWTAEYKASQYREHFERLEHDRNAELDELEYLRGVAARRPSRRLAALLRKAGLLR